MRLATFKGGFGRVEGSSLVPMGDSLVAYLRGTPALDGDPLPLAEVSLLAPVPAPGKVIGVGLNYRAHIDETELEAPSEPVLFAKFANSVIGPGAAIVLPSGSEQVDFEAELVVVIGREAKRVPASEALSRVAGYTAANDVSARDLQFTTGQWLRGKAIDSFLPLGPILITPDEVPEPVDLRIRCTVDGVTYQDSRTSELIFGVRELLSFISQTITLEPGDVILTGTPAGTGFRRKPPLFLQEGNVVTVNLETVGALTNPVSRR